MIVGLVFALVAVFSVWIPLEAGIKAILLWLKKVREVGFKKALYEHDWSYTFFVLLIGVIIFLISWIYTVSPLSPGLHMIIGGLHMVLHVLWRMIGIPLMVSAFFIYIFWGLIEKLILKFIALKN